jgi:signal transduction histidine kinase
MEIKPKILLVDDKTENLIALETVLKDLNLELIRATSGNEALKHTLNHKFALALIDIQMPEMDGYELATILREEEKTANLPFIFISGIYTDHINIFKGYEKGAFSFITKPFEPEILLNKVKLFVDIHQHEFTLKQLNEDLEEKNNELNNLNKELEAFSYSVSHDLRAPLRSINGYSQILLEEHTNGLDEEMVRLLKTISANARKMTDLIDNLLSFSKLGKREVNKGQVDMNLLVNSVVEELKITNGGIKAKWKIDQLPNCYGDYHLIKQVMINLISNAVKYSSKKEEPVIEIGVQSRQGHQIYFVKDNGAGFDMKYVEKLFGVFQRLHRHTEFEGTGVGLATVHRIITKHHGKIWAEAALGEGAAFYFTIPDIQ